jgi:hypothetical protein
VACTVLSPGFLAQQGSGQVSAFHWLEDCANFTPKLEENNQFSQPLLMQYKQQANPLLSMNYYTPLVINGNDKNKEITVLSQCKLALTGRNM